MYFWQFYKLLYTYPGSDVLINLNILDKLIFTFDSYFINFLQHLLTLFLLTMGSFLLLICLQIIISQKHLLENFLMIKRYLDIIYYLPIKNLYRAKGNLHRALISDIKCIDKGVGRRALIGFDIFIPFIIKIYNYWFY